MPKEGDPDSKIHLVSFKPYLTMHSSGTPFGSKIELMLRLADLPYWAHNGDVQNKKVSPKSKVRTARRTCVQVQGSRALGNQFVFYSVVQLDLLHILHSI